MYKHRALLAAGAVAILVGTPLSVIAIGKNEKGCLAGGAIGGIGGHFLGSGNHALIGAAAGCAVGTVVADNKKKKEARARADEKRQAHYAPRDPHTNRAVQPS